MESKGKAARGWAAVAHHGVVCGVWLSLSSGIQYCTCTDLHMGNNVLRATRGKIPPFRRNMRAYF